MVSPSHESPHLESAHVTVHLLREKLHHHYPLIIMSVQFSILDVYSISASGTSSHESATDPVDMFCAASLPNPVSRITADCTQQWLCASVAVLIQISQETCMHTCALFPWKFSSDDIKLDANPEERITIDQNLL